MRLAALIQKQSGERILLLSRPDRVFLASVAQILRFSLSNEILALGQKAHMTCKEVKFPAASSWKNQVVSNGTRWLSG